MKNTVILKSYKDGIAIYLDDTLEFEQLCLDLAQKFRDSARFFGDMQVAVSFEGRTSFPTQRKRRGTLRKNLRAGTMDSFTAAA